MTFNAEYDLYPGVRVVLGNSIYSGGSGIGKGDIVTITHVGDLRGSYPIVAASDWEIEQASTYADLMIDPNSLTVGYRFKLSEIERVIGDDE